MGAIRSTGTDLTLEVRVQPKASRDALKLQDDGTVRVYLTAPPVDGAANTALLRFLAKQLGCSRGMLRLVQGAKSRTKVVQISGVSESDLLNVLSSS